MPYHKALRSVNSKTGVSVAYSTEFKMVTLHDLKELEESPMPIRIDNLGISSIRNRYLRGRW